MIKKSQKHLEETKENYFEHMGNALKISFQLLISALMAFIHGGFWQPMDTLRDKVYLQKLWDEEKAPWKTW